MKQNATLIFSVLAFLGVGYLLYNNFANTDQKDDHAHDHADHAEQADPFAPKIEKEDNTPDLPATVMTFNEMEHDYGDINQDTENEHVFAFTNTGKEPLVISNAVGSCGCTVPEWPKEPIAPGESGDIKVVFKPGKKEGAQTKNVTITANTDPKITKLVIKANVLKPEE